WKAVFAESFDLLKDTLSELGCQTVRQHAADKPLMKLPDDAGTSPASHRTPQLICFAAREPGRYHGQLHRLLLTKRYAECLFKNMLNGFVGIRRYFLLSRAAAQVRMNHIPLDWTGANNGDLNHQVVENFWLKPRQHRHLCAAFDLKHSNGVGSADH